MKNTNPEKQIKQTRISRKNKENKEQTKISRTKKKNTNVTEKIL